MAGKNCHAVTHTHIALCPQESQNYLLFDRMYLALYVHTDMSIHIMSVRVDVHDACIQPDVLLPHPAKHMDR